MVNLENATRFLGNNNHMQALRYAEVALTKLKLLKDDRPLEALNVAFTCKTTALNFMGRYGEAMESAKERYSMWAMTDIRNPNSIWAAFDLIECCLHLNEFVDAEMFARTAYEIINQRTDNIIPNDGRQQILARGAYYLAKATFRLAQAGGIAPEAKQAAGVKAIALAREALEINRQAYGVESTTVATTMEALAEMLDYFNEVDDDEVIRLYEHSISIFARVQGELSVTVAVAEHNLGLQYKRRAIRAHNAHDLDLAILNLNLALPRYCEATRIFKATNRMDYADASVRESLNVKEMLRSVGVQQ